MTKINSNIRWEHRKLSREDYLERNGHPSMVLWFTGLSGAGKSTLAQRVEEKLFATGWYTYILDGDNVRHGLNSDLGFSEHDRRENIRRVGEVAKLFTDSGVVVLAAFISPYREDRDRVRALFEPGDFIEIHVKCALDVCEKRDPKGLYRKSRAGELPEFTGIDSPYEEPLVPELVVDTARLDIDQCVALILDHLRGRESKRRMVDAAGTGAGVSP
ncbi:adenylyl-sulfate kinase [Geomonas propionica]|uniref:adenylyl-sulfate kinase n=1 Tax=Geomonas propionica TaxID=2798582 RepID=UPI001F399DB9|nr:adenylyl-sulfate kinase [Geomonas propionica]